MKITEDIALRNFHFWSGGKSHADELDSEQLDQLEFMLEDIYPDGIDATQLNDMLWFDFDTVKEWLGIGVTEESVEDYVDSNDLDFETSSGETVSVSTYNFKGEFQLCGESESGDAYYVDFNIDSYEDTEECVEDALEKLKKEFE